MIIKSVFPCLALTVLSATPAAAVIRTAVYTTTVTQAEDGLALFGPSGTNLVGKQAVLRFTYDTSVGTPFSVGPLSEGRGTASNAGLPPTVIAAKLTINGRTVTAPVGDGSEVYTSQGLSLHRLVRQEFPSDGLFTFQLQQSGEIGPFMPVMPVRLADTTPSPLLQYRGSGVFEQSFYSYALGDYSYRSRLLFGGTASYEVLSGGAVPEPASWAMLIAGFGLVGAVARRRNRGAALAS